MPAAGRTVIIAGAGISGLTLALALAKFGAKVTVLERSPAIQEYGAGLQIGPNARRVLNQLGLDRQLAQRSFEPRGIDVYPFAKDQPLVTLELGALVRERFGAPYAVMHRADLVDVLYRACRRFANIDVVFDVVEFDVTSTESGVSVTIRTAEGKHRAARAFAFIGADGVHSRTRTAYLSGNPAKRHPYVAWRTLLDIRALEGICALDRTSLLLGPGLHAVVYPLPHRDKINVALFSRQDLSAPGPDGAPRPRLPAEVLRSRQFGAIIDRAGTDWGHWPLATVATDDWYEGNVGLIGDAVHAMVPFQAQGAAMGIEDAAILAPLLMTEPNAEAALQRFAALRRPRVGRVQAVSAANGRAFHMHWPLSMARDAVIAAGGPRGHLSRLDWLYGYDAAPEIEMATAQRTP